MQVLKIMLVGISSACTGQTVVLLVICTVEPTQASLVSILFCARERRTWFTQRQQEGSSVLALIAVKHTGLLDSVNQVVRLR